MMSKWQDFKNNGIFVMNDNLLHTHKVEHVFSLFRIKRQFDFP